MNNGQNAAQPVIILTLNKAEVQALSACLNALVKLAGISSDAVNAIALHQKLEAAVNQVNATVAQDQPLTPALTDSANENGEAPPVVN